MSNSSRLPNFERLSVLVATILLAYASARFVDLPSRNLTAQLPGFYLEISVNTNTAIAILVAGLAASGTHWLLRDHPKLEDRRALNHSILPALTALFLGVPLNNLPFGLLWWAVFAIGGIILLLVMVAEYIAVDPMDIRQPLAAAVLIGLSFAVYLILAISLRAMGLRLFLLLPAMTPSAGLVSLRTFHLRQPGRWMVPQATTIAVLLSQVIAALHYLPIAPVTFGLLTVGPAYVLTTLIGNLFQGRTWAQSILEPTVVFIALLGIALWTR